MKMPEPIMAPMTIIMESKRVISLLKWRLSVSGGAATFEGFVLILSS
jgi:hypothetical protein